MKCRPPVETDASGVILDNPAAAVLFNTSVKHLAARLRDALPKIAISSGSC